MDLGGAHGMSWILFASVATLEMFCVELSIALHIYLCVLHGLDLWFKLELGL